MSTQDTLPPADTIRIELVTAIHMLASSFENSLYAFGKDAEARKIAAGDIAHAMKVAAKYNQNGAAIAAQAQPETERLREELKLCCELKREYQERAAQAITDLECPPDPDTVDRALAQEAQQAQGVPQFLANGARYKVSWSDAGCYISGLPPELAGRWVAFVAAEDNCHLAAAPQAEPHQTYSLDADPAGIRERVVWAITGALGYGQSGTNPAPEGHWLKQFWEYGREAGQWRELFWSVARALGCLPSRDVDGNAHVFRKAEGLATPQAEPLSDADAKELRQWRAMSDPAVLYANLLRGLPAKLTAGQLQNLMGAAEPQAEPAQAPEKPLPEALGEWLTAIGELYIAMGRPKFEATEPTLGVVETLREAAKRLANQASAASAEPQPEREPLTDEQIASAVRPLYQSDQAARIGLADDIRTVRAVSGIGTKGGDK